MFKFFSRASSTSAHSAGDFFAQDVSTRSAHFADEFFQDFSSSTSARSSGEFYEQSSSEVFFPDFASSVHVQQEVHRFYPPLTNFFKQMIDTNLRHLCSYDTICEINAKVSGIIHVDKGQSPHCNRLSIDLVALDATPPDIEFFEYDEVVIVPLSAKGTKFIALMSPGSTIKFLDPSQDANTFCDKFKTGLKCNDRIRDMYKKNFLKNLTCSHPEIVQFFGQDQLTSMFSLFKCDMKIVISIFGFMINDDFLGSEMLKNFWLLMLKWMIFSRCIELLVSMVTKMIQFSNNEDLIISETCMRSLKKLVREILPTQKTSEKEDKGFTTKVRYLLEDTKKIFNAISFYLDQESIDNFWNHVEAIEFDVESLERCYSPLAIVRGMVKTTSDQCVRLFEGNTFRDMLNFSSSSSDFIKSLCTHLRISRNSKIFKVFTSSVFAQRSIVSLLFDERINFLRKQTDEVRAQNKLVKEKIKQVKLERQLLMEQNKLTLTKDRSSTIGSSSACKRSQQPFDEQLNFKKRCTSANLHEKI